jgi:hypothetical protein
MHHDGDTYLSSDSGDSSHAYGMGSDRVLRDYDPGDRISHFTTSFSMFSHILRVLRNPFSFAVWLISFCIVSFFWYSYSAIDYVAANYQSYTYAYFDTFLSWGVILFLPLILSGIVYKSLLFGYKKEKAKSSHIFGVAGGVL